jgi:hypothetical protein
MTAITTQPPTQFSTDSSAPAKDSITPEEATTPVAPEADDDVEESSTVSTTDKNTKTLKRGVSFDKIYIREYSRCLGDNPATTHGPPLSLGWAYNIGGTYDLEEYEENRPQRRGNQQMLVPGSIREEILLSQSDVTRKQISKSVAEIKEVRHRRQMCVAMQEFEEWSWFGETIARRFRRLRSGVSKQKEQQQLWENARRVVESKAVKKALSETFSDDGATEGTECETRPSESSCFAQLAEPIAQASQ